MQQKETNIVCAMILDMRIIYSASFSSLILLIFLTWSSYTLVYVLTVNLICLYLPSRHSSRAQWIYVNGKYVSGHSVITYSSWDESKHCGWDCMGLIEFCRVFGGKIIWPAKEEFAHNIGYNRILVGLWYIGIWTLDILVFDMQLQLV